MTDPKTFLDAVTEMRAAQKLEWEALPANFRIFKQARKQQRVARLEEQVDQFLQELAQTENLTADAQTHNTADPA